MIQPQANNSSHAKFQKTIARSFVLLRTFDFARLPVGDQTHRQPDLLRAAIVISVAGMDAYFTSRFVDAAVAKINGGHDLSDDFVSHLQRSGVNERYLLSILRNDRPLRSIRNKVDSYVGMRVTQSFNAIDEIYKSVGLKQLSKHTCQMAGKARLKSGVERIVARRHQIVHDGDYNKRGRLRGIERDFVERHIRYIEDFGNNSEKIIGNFIQGL